MLQNGIEEVREPQEAAAHSPYDGFQPDRLRSMAEAASDPSDALRMEFAAEDAELKPTAASPEDLLQITPVHQQSGNLYEEIERDDAMFAEQEKQAADLKSHSDEKAARHKIRRARYAKAAKHSQRFEELAQASRIGPAIKPSAETVQLNAMDDYARRNFHPAEYAAYVRNMRRLYPGWAAAFQTPSVNRQLAHPSPHLKGYEKVIRQAMRDVPLMNPYEAQEHIEEHVKTARKMIRSRLRKMVSGSGK